MADDLKYAFKPQTMKVSDEDFLVELKPRCERRFESVEIVDNSDGPTWDGFLKQRCFYDFNAPDADVECVVSYVSWEKTIVVALVGSHFDGVPLKIQLPKTDFGVHYGSDVVVIVNDRLVENRGLKICETTAADRKAIEANRKAWKGVWSTRPEGQTASGDGDLAHKVVDVPLVGVTSVVDAQISLAAGEKRAVVTDAGDRKAICEEVNRLKKKPHCLSQRQACIQVAVQAQNGRAGQYKLTTKYHLVGNTVNAAVVLRILKKPMLQSP
jgi:hypothetical protein